MSKLYAIFPINVGGVKYKAGDEIQCGNGARASLLRCGQATEDDPLVPGEENLAGDSDLVDLQLDSQIVEKLQENKIDSVDQLLAYIDEGNRLSKLSGIGEVTEKKITESIEVYLEAQTEPVTE